LNDGRNALFAVAQRLRLYFGALPACNLIVPGDRYKQSNHDKRPDSHPIIIGWGRRSSCCKDEQGIGDYAQNGRGSASTPACYPGAKYDCKERIEEQSPAVKHRLKRDAEKEICDYARDDEGAGRNGRQEPRWMCSGTLYDFRGCHSVLCKPLRENPIRNIFLAARQSKVTAVRRRAPRCRAHWRASSIGTKLISECRRQCLRWRSVLALAAACAT